MSQDGEEGRRADSSSGQYVFPKDILDGSGDEDAVEDDASPLVVLCAVQASEAELGCRKLEAEGIPCEVEEMDPPADESTKVKILVRDIDREAAREILARPLQADDDADDLDSDWSLCRACRRDRIVAVPPNWPWRLIRWVSALTLFAGGLAIGEIRSACADTFLASGWGWLAALVFVVVCGIGIAGPREEMKCPSCGWTLDDKTDRAESKS